MPVQLTGVEVTIIAVVAIISFAYIIGKFIE
jgi:hypothetical protein